MEQTNLCVFAIYALQSTKGYVVTKVTAAGMANHASQIVQGFLERYWDVDKWWHITKEIVVLYLYAKKTEYLRRAREYSYLTGRGCIWEEFW